MQNSITSSRGERAITLTGALVYWAWISMQTAADNTSRHAMQHSKQHTLDSWSLTTCCHWFMATMWWNSTTRGAASLLAAVLSAASSTHGTGRRHVE